MADGPGARAVTLVPPGQDRRSPGPPYSGRLDVELTETGCEQAREVARKLVGKGVDAVITSPLVRARETAQAIADELDIPLTVDERLTEVDYGPVEGLDREGAKEKFGETFDAWRSDPWNSPLPGMEPLPDALERARAVTADALAGHEHPVLVGHQGILRIVLVALGEIEPDDYFDTRLSEAEPVVVSNPKVVDRRT